MNKNISSRIKGLASVLCWVGIAAAVISGSQLMVANDSLVFSGFLVMVLGSLFSWLGYFVVYGYGEIVENSNIRTELAVKEAEKNEPKQ